MRKVIFGYLFHREKEWISLFGPDELLFNNHMKACKAVWTKTHKCYLLPCNKMAVEKVEKALSPNYIIDKEPLKSALILRKKQIVPPVKTIKENFPRQLNDFERGLRDWELRNA
jgi:hypothetical protein